MVIDLLASTCSTGYGVDWLARLVWMLLGHGTPLGSHHTTVIKIAAKVQQSRLIYELDEHFHRSLAVGRFLFLAITPPVRVKDGRRFRLLSLGPVDSIILSPS